MKISKAWSSGRRKTTYVEGELKYIGISEYYSGVPPKVKTETELCFRITTNPPSLREHEKVLKLRLSEEEGRALIQTLHRALGDDENSYDKKIKSKLTTQYKFMSDATDEIINNLMTIMMQLNVARERMLQTTGETNLNKIAPMYMELVWKIEEIAEAVDKIIRHSYQDKKKS